VHAAEAARGTMATPPRGPQRRAIHGPTRCQEWHTDAPRGEHLAPGIRG
jgi:hypothetical protein